MADPDGDPPALGAKLSPPPLRRTLVERADLLDRMEGTSNEALRAVVAPAGWGKSTALASWVARASGAAAWITFDARDNDPTRGWRHILAGIAQATGLDLRLLDARLRVSAVPLVSDVVEPLLGELGPTPLRIVLDDLHTLTDAAMLESLEAFLAHSPPTVLFGLGSRSQIALGLERRRVAGDVIDVGLDHLRMSTDQARPVVEDAAGRAVTDDAVHELVRRTEGWPAGLSLAGAGLRDASNERETVERFSGGAPQVAQYFANEVIGRLPAEDRAFLLSTAVLRELDGDICDAVRERTDSTWRLAELAESLHFLIPHAAGGYRHHDLFREWLLSEVPRSGPTALPDAHARAARAFAARDQPVEAMEHALASRDWVLAHDLFVRFALVVIGQGNHATVADWCRSFPDDIQIDHLIAVRVTEAWEHILEGDADAAQRLITKLEAVSPPWATPTAWTADAGQLAVMRAFCHELRGDLTSASTELESARVAEVAEPTDLPMHFITATTKYWLGEPDEGLFLAVATRAAELEDPYAEQLCHAFVAHIHLDALNDAKARAWVATIFDAVESGDLSTFWWGAAGHLARARVALRDGDNDSAVADARTSIELAQRRDNRLLTGFGHLVLAEALHATGERSGARAELSSARDILEAIEGGGVLAERTRVVERQLRLPSGSNVPRYSEVPVEELSDREMTLLRLLPGDLNQRELGRVMNVSFNTIKTYNRAIYRKLGVASRDDAVAAARAFGLL